MAPAGFVKHSKPEKKSVDEVARRKALLACCKKATKFTFSNLGLCVVMILYAVAGAYMFMQLEQTNEKELCIQTMNIYNPMESTAVSKLWDISTSLRSTEDESQVLAAFQTQVQQFGADVVALAYNGRNCTLMGETGGPSYTWNFPGTLLFSITVFTTIGYGNIAPKTTWGRLVSISYALIGIPLMLLCLANLGEVMADIFRFVYSRICCCGCIRNRKKEPENVTDKSSENPSSPEDWKNRYEAQKTVEENTDPVDEDDDEDEKVSVPLTVTMAVVGGYIFMGALLFGVWEEWEWITAAYYCFITISTIGFGDVVPGTSGYQTADDNWKLIAASGYIVFGMAIMSMAFNLIQEEIVAKFVWLGHKLGLTKKPKEDEDENKVPLETAEPIAKTMPVAATRPVSSYPPPANAGLPFGPGTAANMFSTPKKQPATYNGSGSQSGNDASLLGTDSPLTKRAAMTSAYRK